MTSGLLAMFPLGAVLFPHGRMELQVFEPRYREMVADCLAGDGEFGVVLISRGSEVGGGDERVDVGTRASIDAAEPLADGRWHLAVRGQRRIRVTRWLEDDPYPRAVVEDWGTAFHDAGEALRVAEAEIRRVRALVSELGEAPAVPVGYSFGDSPDEIAWSLCASAPLNSFDRQRLLEAPGPDERLGLLVDLVRAVGEDLRRILAGG
jgi:Lon protease-like protein